MSKEWQVSRKQMSREKIIEVASKVFKKEGIKSASVAEVMSAAGFTVGGFYAHFKSKTDLIAQAFFNMSKQADLRARSVQGATGRERARRFFQTYLSRTHRDNPDKGCQLAALASEFAQLDGTRGEQLRKIFADELEQILKIRADIFSDGTDKMDKQQIIQFMSMAVGAIVLSRASKDSPISDEILAATFKGLSKEID